MIVFLVILLLALFSLLISIDPRSTWSKVWGDCFLLLVGLLVGHYYYDKQKILFKSNIIPEALATSWAETINIVLLSFWIPLKKSEN